MLRTTETLKIKFYVDKEIRDIMKELYLIKNHSFII